MASSPTVGPETGSLVIVGGGKLMDPILQRVIDLAGGPSAPIVVIPTAGGEPTYNDHSASADDFRRLGSADVTVLHTYDPKVADTEDFARPLLEARGVWFGGGRQWRLVDAYAGTLTEKRFWGVLERGGVIGGSSAGATIQGDFLARGDTKGPEVIVGDHQKGFGFFKGVAIDQHLLARNRHFDMFEVLKIRPELLGIGINENTALVVSRNNAVVLGASLVAIYDGTFWAREGTDPNAIPDSSHAFYFLQDGDKYDLGQRKVVTDDS